MQATKHNNPSYGFHLTYPGPGIVERVAPYWEWFWIDCQHGQIFSLETQIHLVRTCKSVGRQSYIRIPHQTSHIIQQTLSLSPDGLIIPQVENKQQAEDVAKSCCFPPQGIRSYGDRRSVDLHGRSYWSDPATRPRIIVQIESVDSVSNIDDILSTEGIDGAFFGPDDYCMSLFGEPWSPDFIPEIRKAMLKVGAACHQRKKSYFAVGTSPILLEQAQLSGSSHIVGVSDAALLSKGSEEKLASIKLTKSPSSPDAGTTY